MYIINYWLYISIKGCVFMELPKKGFILPDGIILDCFGERHCIRALSYIKYNCQEEYDKSITLLS